MTTAAAIMRPLPVRPVDRARQVATSAPLPHVPTGPVMRPLPMPTPGHLDLSDAIRDLAARRLLDRA